MLLSVLAPMLVLAQRNVLTYNEQDKQVMFCHVNEKNVLETFAILDEQDMNTVKYDETGRVTELTNSLGTMNLEYEDDCINLTYMVNGQLLSRHVYHYNDENYQAMLKEVKLWSGQLNTTDKVVNFLNSKAFQKSYDQLETTLDRGGNRVKALYEKVIRKAVYGDKSQMNGMDQAVDDMISMVIKLSGGIADNIKDEIFKNPRKNFDRLVSWIYDWQNKKYQQQKKHNSFEMAWREGLWEKVLRNEITIEEATAKVTEVMAKKRQFEREHPDMFSEVMVTLSKDEATGEEKVEFKQVDTFAEKDGAPLEAITASKEGNADLIWKKLDQKYISTRQYGRLDRIEIYYEYYKSASPEHWTYIRHPSSDEGKLKQQSHSPYFYGDSFGTSPNRWKFPFYKVELFYENDMDYKNWGTVMIRLWLSPSGNVLNSYMEDNRHHSNPNELDIHSPKITGSNWLNLNVEY